MSETEIVEWLLRWLLEFGPEPVPWGVRCVNPWYRQCMLGDLPAPGGDYFTSDDVGNAELTPAAWKLLENYHESNH